MNVRNRISILAAAALLLIATGTVLATRTPTTPSQPAQLTSSHEAERGSEAEDGPPSAEDLAHAADRLSAAGITADGQELADLSSRYGLGGAVRLVAWADETGMDVDEITAMRDGDGSEGSVRGWGQIAKELGVHPGIGSIMGNGGGHGRENAPGQQKDRGPDEAGD